MPTSKLVFFLLLLLPLACFAQNDASQKIISKFNSYSAAHPGEKVYLHLDRPYYGAGDTLYYKAYLTLHGSNELSALSGVLHVELIDNLQGKALFIEKLEITNGVAWGDFALPDTLINGSYKIRAYTNLMRNDGEADFFEKDIPIVAVKPKSAIIKIANKTPAAAPAAAILSKPDLQFFPEGGSLVDGISSKVAFKAVNTNGLGIAVKGEVSDNDGKKICSFTSSHLGMGSFNFTPLAGKNYKVSVTYDNGVQDVANLPTATNSGLALSAVNDSMLVIPINIHATPAYFAANKGRMLTLTVFTGGELINIPYPLDSAAVQGYLYKKKLYSGITRLTLFSPDGEPLCERLVFINNNDQLRLNINSEEPAYGKRQKVVVHMSAKDVKDMPVSGDFSVAVTDETKAPVDTNAESTIVNYLLLSSELKGNIEQPNYYFNNSSSKAQSDLDNLMLTQGYRRFDWKAVMNNTDSIPQYQPEKLLSIKGTVKTLSGKPVPNAEVALGSIKQLIARDTTADGYGNFAFNNLFIADTANLLIRAGKGNKSWKAEIAKEYEPQITTISLQDTALTLQYVKPQTAAAMQKEYEQYGSMKNGIVLKQVNIKENKNPLHLAPLLHSDNMNGAGMANQVIMGDKLVGCANVAQCLESQLLGVRIVEGSTGPVFINNRTPIALKGNTKAMAVELNGIVMDQSVLSEINPDDIYSIEVLESAYYLTIYGSRATGGLLVITLKNGSERNLINAQPGLTTYLFHGFYKARQFYAPAYDVKQANASTPDIRTTLFWNPVLLTKKDGRATFNFYTSDHAGKYRVVVEGISSDGNIGRAVYECVVQ